MGDAQVVDILLAWAHSRDWATALKSVVPTRKRAASEAAKAGDESTVAGKHVIVDGMLHKAVSDSAVVSEPAEVAVSQPADTAGTEVATTDGEPAQAAKQPSSSAGAAPPAVPEPADGDAEGRQRDVAEGQQNGISAADAAQHSDQAAAQADHGGQRPSQLPAAGKAAPFDAPRSNADDLHNGDGGSHSAKKQKTAP